jgi:hypothetical protein
MSSLLEISSDGYAAPCCVRPDDLSPYEFMELTPLELLPDFVPSEADQIWWAILSDVRPIRGGAPDDRADADWDEMARQCEWQDRLEQTNLITDDDIAAAGLAVG